MSYLSRAYYTGDGTTTQFAVPFAYLAQAHVSVLVNGVSRAFTWANANLVTVSPAPAAGTSVAIIRTTPGATPQASFNDSNSIPAASLNRNFMQALYVSQEALDVGENGAPLAEASAAQAASSAAAAQSQASAAAASATTAQSQASAAAASATAASASAASAATALDSFDDRYLGAKASDPTVDNDGAALVVGALYYRTTSPAGMRVWDGATWLAASAFQQYVIRSGDTMTGPLVLSGNAAQALQAVPLQQVEALTGGFRNRVINGNPLINQRAYVSGTATAAANQYTLDRWRVVTSGQAVSWADAGGVRTVTAPAGGMEQVIEASMLPAGTYCVSWVGTATCTVNGTAMANGGTFTSNGVSNYTVRMIGGTWSLLQVEQGTRRTAFEFIPLDVTMELCNRYTRSGTYKVWGYGVAGSVVGYQISFSTPMRASPSVTRTLVGSNNASELPTEASSSSVAFPVSALVTGGVSATYSWIASAEF